MSCAPNDPTLAVRLVGDPIDAVTGAHVEVAWELVLPWRVPFEWVRHYDSARVGERFALGWGHAHGYERSLRFDADGMRYVGPLGAAVTFPLLLADGAVARAAGLTLRRLGALHYHVKARGRPAMEFRFAHPAVPAPLAALVSGDARLDFRYRDDGALAGVDEPNGRAVRVLCDDERRVRRLVLVAADGASTRDLLAYDYDAASNLVRGIDAYRNAYYFQHDAAHRVVRRTHQNGYSFHFAFDDCGRCVQSSGEDGIQAVRLDYRPDEMRTLVTKSDGGVWEYRYDDARRLTAIVDPYGGSRAFNFDEAGNVAEEVDPNGDVTQWVYDDAGALLGKRSSLGHFAAGGDAPLRPDQRVHRVPTRPAEWEFGDLLADADADGPADDAELPPDLRRLVAHVGPRRDGVPVARDERDELGTRLRTVRDDGRARHWSYDAGGNTVRYHDYDGALTRCEYASWDLPVRRIDPLGRAVTRRFTASEQVAEEVDPAGVRSAYVYDLKGRVAEFWYDGSRLTQHRYDAADNLVATLDADGAPLLELEIGDGNLRTTRRLASGETHRFEYTARGYYAAVATDDVSVAFDYDAFDNRTADVRDGRGVRHEFVAPRVVARTTVFGRFTTLYRRRSTGLLEIRDPGGATHEVRFLGRGVVLRRMSSGLAEAARFDASGRCAAKASAHVGARGWLAPWVREYTYSGEGDLLEVRDSAAVAGVRYEYDAAHRLVREVVRDESRARFRHDDGDNLVEQPGLDRVSVGQGNRLLAANGETFAYDARGNVVLRRGPAGATAYRYDSRNQLVACDTPRGEWRAAYDPLGRRVRTSLGDEWREYFWDTDRLAAELRSDGRLRVYVYADAFALVPLLWLDYDSPDADPAAGRRYFVQCDHLGVPRRVESEVGDVVWRAAVRPYGALAPSAEARVEMPFRFPGHYHDAATGLHYNRFRYYDPTLGRYLQPDPLGTEGGRNLFAYTTNPLKEVDVRGDCSTNGTAPPQNGTTEGGEPARRPRGPIQIGLWAFNTLTRGGGRTNEHANRVVAALTRLGLRRANRSVTVIQHADGSVSIGLSGPDVPRTVHPRTKQPLPPDRIPPPRHEEQERVVADLNREHPDTTYRTTDGPVQTEGLNDPGSRQTPTPLPGNCSEPAAAQAAGSHDSPPRSYQTISADPAGPPAQHQLPGRPTAGPGGAEQMCACATCRSNMDNYDRIASQGSTPADDTTP
jgi:RHS repeat-associated protein